jgi:uroporphyrinogen decarboxylase
MAANMTGKERLYRALASNSGNVALDRPPADFWAEDAAKERLYAYLNRYDLTSMLDDLGIDIRETNAKMPAETKLDCGVYQNHWGERYIYRETKYGRMREDTAGALSTAASLGDIAGFPWPRNDDFGYSELRAECDAIAAKGCAIRYGWADVWQRAALVRGLENALTDLYVNPEWMHYSSNVFTNFYIEDYRRAWEASGGQIDLFVVISDLGTQSGPMMSLKMFREFVAPYVKRLVDEIHRFGAKALFHSCGDIGIFIPDLIGLGVDVLDPIQPVTQAMRPENLIKYKGAICFHGGLDVQTLLLNGTPAEIGGQARKYSTMLGPGYILSPAHFFQPDIPPENIVAVYDAFRRG